MRPRSRLLRLPVPKWKRRFRPLVILPDAYSERNLKKFPVLYLLHGAGGNHASWNQSTQCAQLADKYEFIILCPDGGSTSWYYDSPIDPAYQYETHVAEECVQYMDQNYRTKANRGSRAISGMSMGGHGAMYLAIRHPDTFGTSVCLMGGVDIRPFPNNWEIKKRLGEIGTHRKNWEEHTVINQAKKLKDEEIKIVLDCGRGDFFLQVNWLCTCNYFRTGSVIFTRSMRVYTTGSSAKMRSSGSFLTSLPNLPKPSNSSSSQL